MHLLILKWLGPVSVAKLSGGTFRGMSRIVCTHTYDNIISVENLLAAWKEFLNGKRTKKDVQEFELQLMDNVLHLHTELAAKTYHHGPYHAFKISDPKPREIHKALVRDRLLHHAIYRKLYPFFDRTFIADSYSCRVNKGTHRAMNRFRDFAHIVSKNHTKTLWILKCDIRKFFASVDHKILFEILHTRIADPEILSLLRRIVESFETSPSKGLPLGNLTSQLLVNIYLNEFDQFVKQRLKAKYYIRYADDFVFLSRDKAKLEQALRYTAVFLRKELKLQLHPNKVSITTIASGVDFLGWVHFPDHRVLRTSTKRRMLRRTVGLEEKSPTVKSYLGMLGHGNGKKLKELLMRNLAP